MKKNDFYAAVIMIILALIFPSSMTAQVVLEIETGIVNTGYNDVRIPGNLGTNISLKNDLKPSSDIYYRLKLNYTFGSSHTISLLFAPLTVKSEGVINKDVSFAGKLFPANKDLSGSYKFNSYRLTYRYDFVQNPKFELGVGFTAKIRDAGIAISSTGINAEKFNVGFVPIINFRLLWHLQEKLGFILEGDALAAKQGRAVDILLAANYKLSDQLGIRAGYRILEGGADNNEVYNFALLQYMSLGISYKF